MHPINKEIKDLLLKENVTLREVAEHLGKSPQNLSNQIRTGRVKYNVFKEIIKMLKLKIEFVKEKQDEKSESVRNEFSTD